MSIDLDKHRDSILKAFNDVVSDKKPEDWALFGYEGQTNTLKVVGTGEDGLEELADDLNSSKIMYAVVKVIDPNTTRHKIVLINWQGEGAPTVRKGTCARHLQDVRRLLQGIHVTVNARVEEEVEPEVVMAAVLKASASSYNFSERSETGDRTAPVKKTGPSSSSSTSSTSTASTPSTAPRPSFPARPRLTFAPTTPTTTITTIKTGGGGGGGGGVVGGGGGCISKSIGSVWGTNYRRTNPLAEIDSRSRNKFWEEQEEEEKRRKQEEQQRKEEELKKLEKERKQREILEAQHREQLTKERNSRILAGRRAEEEAARNLSANQQRWHEQSANEQQAEEDERGRRAEVMRQQRKKEAEALIGGRTHAARDLFEQHTTTATTTTTTNRPPPRRLKEFNPVNNAREDMQGTPQQQQQQQQQQHTGPSKGVTARWPPAAAASSSPAQQVSTPSPAQRRTTTAAAAAHHTPVQDMIPAQSTPPGPPSKQPPTESPQTAHPEAGGGVGGGYVRNLMKEGLPLQPKEEEEEEEKEEEDQWGEEQEPPAIPTTTSPSLPHIPPSSTQLLSAQPYAPPSHGHSTTTHIAPPSIQSPTPPFSTPSYTQLQNNKNLAMKGEENSSSGYGIPSPPLSTYSIPPPQDQVEEKRYLPPGQSHFGGDSGSYTNGLHQSELRNGTASPTRQNGAAHQHHTTTTTTAMGEEAVSVINQTPVIDESAGMIYEVDGVEYQILPEHGLCARALYDYQAADDTEITFDPSEIITNIDRIDEGWWQGVDPDGMYGLFPANYVELINEGREGRVGGGGGGVGGGGGGV
ncbi:drebrin-like protein isoform X1 [Scylla paramamosain]|uniref:drebrin-like protein isoform X1 n=1 Tax=Scylla paramamosain TaxID=85552 RepID=UPI00308312E1